MSSMARMIQNHMEQLAAVEPDAALGAPIVYHRLAGYVLESPTVGSSTGVAQAWRYVLVSVSSSSRYREAGVASLVAPQPPLNGSHQPIARLQPVGRVVAVAHSRAEPATAATVVTLRPVRNGDAFRIVSPQTNGVVRPEVAETVEAVLNTFAQERGFTSNQPLDVNLSRGFQAGSPGHGDGRALDIAAIRGKGLQAWKQEWDRAIEAAEKISDPQERTGAIATEQKRNLGYRLYKALQAHGGWRVDQDGWRPYRGVTQLFGPWTATEGPWRAMHITDPTSYQRQRLADQRWVFKAHQDHIHVAR